MFIVNVEGAVYRNDEWLVIVRSMKEEHAGGTLSLVGGKADAEGNTVDILERTVRREIFEEVGITIKPAVTFVYSSSFVTDDGLNVINVVFLCEYDAGEARIKSPEEVESVHWMTLDEILKYPKAPPWTKENIRRSAIAKETTK